MIDAITQWPHLWFGVWREYGPRYRNCPSAFSFVDAQLNHTYQKAQLIEYLTSAPVWASTSRRNFPNPFTGEQVGGSISYRTDGRWLWLDDLADYVAYHELVLPIKWLAEIEERNYSPPEFVDDEIFEHLDWPPIITDL
jgi:hypothetical protein